MTLAFVSLCHPQWFGFNSPLTLFYSEDSMYEIAPLLDDPIHNLKTVRDVFRWAITEMENADISYGHLSLIHI